MAAVVPLAARPSRRAWFAAEPALRLIDREQREVTPLLTGHIGVRGLYLRPSAATTATLAGNMLQSVASVYRLDEGDRFAGDARFEAARWPFGSDSLSLVYALHVLTAEASSAALLGEAARCLQPEGLLLVITLSGGSPWRLRWQRAGVAPPAAGSLLRWFDQHGLVVESTRAIGHVFPRLGSDDDDVDAGSGWRWLDAFRSSRLWVARKRRQALTPRPAFSTRPASAGIG